MATIPLDCVNEILSYLPEGGGATPQLRTEKPHIKEYLNSFCMSYTSSNLKYFNKLRSRTAATNFSDPRRRGPTTGLLLLISAAEAVAAGPSALEGWMARQRRHVIDVSKHQCCALTTRGHRCKNKTFGLFCPRHEGSTTCYWTAPSSLSPAH